MNKARPIVLSVLITASLLLNACTTAATQTPVPANATTAPSSSQSPATTQAPASPELSGTIAVSGAFALYPMMTVWADQFSKLHPNVQFDVQGGGAGKGMTDVLAGAVDIGMISRTIKSEEEQKGAYWVPVARDAVFPVVSANNPVLSDLVANGISQDMFKKIFITGEAKTWGEVIGKPEVKDPIHVFTRSDSAGAADQWALYSGGKVQADILSTAIGVSGEPALVDTVSKDPLGIGYSNLNSVFDMTTGKLVQGVVVPPIDINGNGKADPNEYYQTKNEAVKVIADGTYPSPPARFENLATKGKPTGLTLAFIQWILTDGQKMLDQAGYVPLTSQQQTDALAKLK